MFTVFPEFMSIAPIGLMKVDKPNYRIKPNLLLDYFMKKHI